MDNWQLEKHAQIGIQERVSIYTVAIDVSLAAGRPKWGTGSLIEFNRRFFILTCKHVVLENYKDEGVRIIFNPDRGLQIADNKNEIKQTPVYKLNEKVTGKSFPEEITIINRFYSENADDLVFLEFNPLSKQVKENEFYDLSKLGIIEPEVDKPMYLSGFSAELARRVARYGFGVFPYFLASQISTKEIDSDDFNPQKSFLIEFERTEDAVDPHGLSGCGVWTRLPSGKDNFWTPNIFLVGVQTGYYEGSQLLVATKANRILGLIK
jgi:hypothetical protein